MNAFLICPVRGHDPLEAEAFVAALEDRGWAIYWPPRDTDQGDPVGLDICKQNLAAIKQAERVFIIYDPTSDGSLFDLGMAFALGKPLTVLHAPPENASGKGFGKMIRAWADENKR